jgi:hypothetical protein
MMQGCSAVLRTYKAAKLHYDALSVEAAMAFRSDRRFPDLMCPTAEF